MVWTAFTASTLAAMMLMQPSAGDAKPAPGKPDAPAAAAEPAKASDVPGVWKATSPVERFLTGHMFTEGPVWVADAGDKSKGSLYFTDIPQDAIFRWTPGDDHATLLIKPTGRTFGIIHAPGAHARGAGGAGGTSFIGTLGDKRVDLITQATGADEEKPETRTLAKDFEGKAFNGPNDLIAFPDGSIVFTDPAFRKPTGDANARLDFSGVFRIAPDGAVSALDKTLKTPNGLALSADDKTLYVADMRAGEVYAFAVTAGFTLENKKLFCSVKSCDGMRVDAEGRVYVAGAGGVSVFSAAGELVGVIPVKPNASNCAFGGADNKTLFITSGKSLYKTQVETAGRVPHAPKLAAKPVDAPKP